MPGVLSSNIEPKTKITDDKINTGKWEKTPFTFDKTVRIERQSSNFDFPSDKKSFQQSYAADSNEEINQFAPEDAGSRKITWIALTIVCLIIFFTVGGFLWFYPEKKNQALQWMVSNIPYVDKIITADNEQKNQDTGPIKFFDVRQRFIKNTSLGRNIRVIEGIVKNNTAADISKVKLLGELYDAEGSLLLTSKASLAGNVLTDDKLENLDEDKIFSALSIAPASNLSEAKIPPMGQAPFMIVFTREPARVFKLVVTPVSE